MKSAFFFLFIAFTYSFSSYAQSTNCDDGKLHYELVTLNESFENQGFKLFLFQSLNIQTKTYLPIKLQLEQGKMYQINYIVQDNFKNYDMILIDKNKKELFKIQVKNKKTDKHYSSQGLVAPYSGDYWLILTLKVGGAKKACAGLSVMESMN